MFRNFFTGSSGPRTEESLENPDVISSKNFQDRSTKRWVNTFVLPSIPRFSTTILLSMTVVSPHQNLVFSFPPSFILFLLIFWGFRFFQTQVTTFREVWGQRWISLESAGRDKVSWHNSVWVIDRTSVFPSPQVGGGTPGPESKSISMWVSTSQNLSSNIIDLVLFYLDIWY